MDGDEFLRRLGFEIATPCGLAMTPLIVMARSASDEAIAVLTIGISI